MDRLIYARGTASSHALAIESFIKTMPCTPADLIVIFAALQASMGATREVDYSEVQNCLDNADKALDDCYAVTLEDRAEMVKEDMRGQE